MQSSRLEIAVGTSGTLVLLAALSIVSGLGPAGWTVGVLAGCGATTLHVVARCRRAGSRLGPADWVTLARAVLTAGIAALVVDRADGTTTTLVALACVALALDAVDGQVARRTRTASTLGARFDGEVDAFLILVLSVEVSRDYGSWVLAIGAARYLFLVAGWVASWLAAPLPSRFWGKAVAAVQGIVLTVAASGAMPRLVGMCAVAAALVLLASSFGHDVGWLYRRGAGSATPTLLAGSSWQERPHRLRRELRAGRRARHELLAPAGSTSRPGDQLNRSDYRRVSPKGSVSTRTEKGIRRWQ